MRIMGENKLGPVKKAQPERLNKDVNEREEYLRVRKVNAVS